MSRRPSRRDCRTVWVAPSAHPAACFRETALPLIALVLTAIFLLPVMTWAGVIYKCTDKSGKTILTDKPLGKEYNCTVLERYKDPTPEERVLREAKPVPPAAPSERPAGEVPQRRTQEGGAGEEPAGPGDMQEGQPRRAPLPGEPGGPQIRFPLPSPRQPAEGQEAVPQDTQGQPGQQGDAGQGTWGKSRYGYYPIPPRQPETQQQEQQQQQ